jgi:hypothetical protein
MAHRLAALSLLLLICPGILAAEELFVGRAREREQIQLDTGARE